MDMTQNEIWNDERKKRRGETEEYRQWEVDEGIERREGD